MIWSALTLSSTLPWHYLSAVSATYYLDGRGEYQDLRMHQVVDSGYHASYEMLQSHYLANPWMHLASLAVVAAVMFGVRL